ncbi:hypothetical protein Xoosp14_13 [Xanthomonas phage Xoo-sp14]|nr:hypothetical protein Xoosp14_13 [Xanthomonas phage Xoo-sp14]
MPSGSITIDETYDSISRPVVYDVVRQIQKLTGAPIGTTIQYIGMSGASYMNGSTLTPPEEFNTFSHANKMRVEVVEDVDERSFLTMNTHQKNAIAVFSDQALGVLVYPIYSATMARINFQFRAENATVAERFRNDLRMRTGKGRMENLHVVDYSYSFPKEFQYILSRIYDLREEQGGYGQEFDEYLEEHGSNKLTVVTNQVGQQPRLVIAEQQIQVQGWFEFSALPDHPTKDGEASAVQFDFSYVFQYDKVTGAHIEYPMVVHNQVIPEDIRPAHGEGIYSPDQHYRAQSFDTLALEQFSKLFRPPGCCLDGVVLPYFDDWMPKRVPTGTSSIITLMIAASPNSDRNLGNLYHLGDWKLDDDLMAFLIAERKYISVLGKSVVHMALFEGNMPLTDGAVSLAEDGCAIKRLEIDMRKVYHLRLSMLNHLQRISTEDWNRMRKHGKALVKLLTQIQCGFANGAWIPELLPNGSVAMRDIEIIVKRVQMQRGNYFNGVEHVMLTVGNYTLVTWRKEDVLRDGSGSQQGATGADASADWGSRDESRVSRCDGEYPTRPELFPADIRQRPELDR